MNNLVKPLLKRQLLIMGSGIALYFLVAYFFGFLIGYLANILFFTCVIFYARKRVRSIHRSNLINYSRAVNFGRNISNERTRLRYVCLSCGAETKSAQCSACGSKIRKPLF